MYHARETGWQGEPVVEFGGSGMTARLSPRLGGNLFSLWSESLGRDLLLCPPSPTHLKERPTRWGTPVLMPPNRLAGGRFTFGGHTYQFDRNRGEHHAHGLVLALPWEVTALEAGPHGARVEISLASARFFDVLRQFPHAFTLRVEYRLADGVLTCSTWCRNHSDRPMPFGLGFHTYFSAPGDQAGYTVQLDAATHWETQAGFPVGAHPAAGPYDLREAQPLGPLDDIFSDLGRDADGWSRVTLADRETGRAVICEADRSFPHWVLFSGAMLEQGFFAAEPYGLISNGFNLDLPAEVTGMRSIGPGTEAFAGIWRIRTV